MAEEMKARSRGISRDMSPRAISRRFDVLVELDRAARGVLKEGLSGLAGESWYPNVVIHRKS